jgi:hypothetical protein
MLPCRGGVPRAPLPGEEAPFFESRTIPGLEATGRHAFYTKLQEIPTVDNAEARRNRDHSCEEANMSVQKRKIKAKPFVRDLSLGTGEEELMRKYALSRDQLYGVFRKLVNAGALDALELYMRTSLSDSGIIKFLAETSLPGQAGDQIMQFRAPEPLDSGTELEITEQATGPARDLLNILPELTARVSYGSSNQHRR